MTLDNQFTQSAFENQKIVDIYKKSVDRIGLWSSEEYFIKKYFKPSFRVLDIGCGCGRTSFGMSGIGFGNIVGIDIARDMVDTARSIESTRRTGISFIEADAGNMPFEDGSFDCALFSYNGLMHIPGRDRRIGTMREILRVLRNEGVFIFVTQVREDPDFELFWRDEKKVWDSGRQDARLNEFGDVIFSKKRQDIFLHVPSTEEVMECVVESGFSLVEYKSRHEVSLDPRKIGKTDSMFWIIQRHSRNT